MVFLIAKNIIVNLFLPKLCIVIGPYKIAATFVTMPEATIHENDSFILWENNVRFPGKTYVIFSVSKAMGKQVFANNFFWLCVFSVNTRHIIATYFL